MLVTYQQAGSYYLYYNIIFWANDRIFWVSDSEIWVNDGHLGPLTKHFGKMEHFGLVIVKYGLMMDILAH